MFMGSWVTQLLQPVEGDSCPSSAFSVWVCVCVLFVCACWWLMEPGRVCRGDSMEHFSMYHRKKLLILCTASVLYYLTCIHYMQSTTITKYSLFIFLNLSLKMSFYALCWIKTCFLPLFWFFGSSSITQQIEQETQNIILDNALKAELYLFNLLSNQLKESIGGDISKPQRIFNFSKLEQETQRHFSANISLNLSSIFQLHIDNQ